jgi:CDP-diacylglycerol---glycerol-3-phosphate 3-phosphatidyltransferase
MTTSFGPSAIATPANAVTIGRVALTPLLLGLILGTGDSWPAFALWTVLAGTDGLDGFLARRHGTTRSGAFLDPLADKILVLGAMSALVATHHLWWLPVALIAVREIGISAYRSFLGRQGVSVPARSSAKVKTFVQALAVGFALLPITAEDARWVANSLLWASVALAWISAVQYLLDHRAALDAV